MMDTVREMLPNFGAKGSRSHGNPKTEWKDPTETSAARLELFTSSLPFKGRSFQFFPQLFSEMLLRK